MDLDLDLMMDFTCSEERMAPAPTKVCTSTNSTSASTANSSNGPTSVQDKPDVQSHKHWEKTNGNTLVHKTLCEPVECNSSTVCGMKMELEPEDLEMPLKYSGQTIISRRTYQPTLSGVRELQPLILYARKVNKLQSIGVVPLHQQTGQRRYNKTWSQQLAETNYRTPGPKEPTFPMAPRKRQVCTEAIPTTTCSSMSNILGVTVPTKTFTSKRKLFVPRHRRSGKDLPRSLGVSHSGHESIAGSHDQQHTRIDSDWQSMNVEYWPPETPSKKSRKSNSNTSRVHKN